MAIISSVIGGAIDGEDAFASKLAPTGTDADHPISDPTQIKVRASLLAERLADLNQAEAGNG
jgi:hypothetical protein